MIACLRAATAVDLPAIRALIREVGINPLGLDWRRFLLAVDRDGRLLACGQIKPHRDGSRELASIAVVPDQRGRGLALAVISALLAQQPPPLWLTCMAGLAPFYEPFGFRRIEDPTQMAPYYRRLTHLAALFMTLSRGAEPLAVMKWG